MSKSIDKLYNTFSKIFTINRNTKRTIKNEWNSLGVDSLESAKSAILLIKKRLDFIYTINNMKFNDPVHVCGSLREYRHFASYGEAKSLYPIACRHYIKTFKKYVKNNLVVNVEIGFDNSIKPDFEIHCHIIMERVDYENYKLQTKDWRLGKFKEDKFFDTRIAKRTYKDQTNNQYVKSLGKYFTKFSLLEGDSRIKKGGKASKPHEDQSFYMEDYITLHYKNGFFIQSTKEYDKLNLKCLRLYKKLNLLYRQFIKDIYSNKLKDMVLAVKKLKTKHFTNMIRKKKQKSIRNATESPPNLEFDLDCLINTT